VYGAVIIPGIFVLYSVQCSFIPGTFVLYRVQCSIYTVYICSVQSTVQHLSREYLFCREYSAVFIPGNICSVHSTVQSLSREYLFGTEYSVVFIPGIFVLYSVQ
jgi:hypothetical protein